MLAVPWGAARPPLAFPQYSTPPDSVGALAGYSLQNMPYGMKDVGYDTHRGERVDLSWKNIYWQQYEIPRTLCPVEQAKKDNRSPGALEFTANFTADLRPAQEPFCTDIVKMLEYERGGIGEAETGFGKTVCAAKLITVVGRSTCVVIPKGDLDWKGELLQFTDIPEDKIDYWQGSKLPDPEAWVVIASLQSIYRQGHYSPEVYNRFGFVIFDEAHRLGAPEFSNACTQFPGYWRLALSATPDRRDGKMDLVRSHIGWRHVVGESAAVKPDYFVIKSDWVEPRNKAGKIIPYDPKKTNSTKRNLIEDPVRNAKIAGPVWKAHNAGRRTIVFIEQKIHGQYLKWALKSMGVPEASIVEYNGETKKGDRERAKACPPGMILLATYKFTAEGTNIPALDTAVIGHPIYDPRQAVGRVLRLREGKHKPVVLDVWDVHSKTLNHLAQRRWKYLKEMGADWRGEYPT